VFVPERPFKPSVTFARKARAYPIEAPFMALIAKTTPS